MGNGARARQLAGGARTAAPMSRKKLRIAFLCFYPDWGHVLPLLKIAKAARDAGHSVKCYVPQRAEHLAQRYGVPVFPLEQEPEQHAEQEVLKVLGSKSIFFLQHSGYGHTSLFIDPPVLRAAAAQLDDVIADVKAFAPDVVVGDRHNLASAYELVARICGARYISNGPSGTLAHLYRPFVTFYGKPISKLGMSAVETAGSLFRRVYRPLFYARHLRRWSASREIKRTLQANMSRYDSAPLAAEKPWALTAGLTWIETHFLNDTPAWTPEVNQVDLPPLSSPPEALPLELEDWLSRSSEPVVYISFGSLIGLNEATYRAIGEGLKKLPCRVIWSTPLGDTGALRTLAQDPRFQIVRYVPQAELLKRKELACFVTHGGAGSVQEAMLGGTPLLCVPLSSDNGYISGLVERLGVGKRLWKRELGQPAFVEALETLLVAPAYKRRAEEVADVLRSAGAEAQVVAFLEKAGASKPTAPN